MFTLKFRLLSIRFTSEEFETGRKMSEIEILQQLPPGTTHGIAFQTERNASVDRGTTFGL